MLVFGTGAQRSSGIYSVATPVGSLSTLSSLRGGGSDEQCER